MNHLRFSLQSDSIPSVITLLITDGRQSGALQSSSIPFVAEENNWRCKDSLLWPRLAAFTCRLQMRGCKQCRPLFCSLLHGRYLI